ncbi:MAG TPA: cohesin domain-containing protein, partial [Candidatus Saccharimonadia bacterium]
MKCSALALIVLMVASIVVAALPVRSIRAAGSVQLSLGPAAHNVSKGATFTMTINLATVGEAVDTVSAELTYPSSRLACVSVANSPDFTLSPQPDVCSGGSIVIQRGRTSGHTSNGVIATVTFQTLMSGDAQVTVNNTSQVLSGGEEVDYTSASADYYVVNGLISYTWALSGQGGYTDASRTTPRDLSTMMAGQSAWLVVRATNTG